MARRKPSGPEKNAANAPRRQARHIPTRKTPQPSAPDREFQASGWSGPSKPAEPGLYIVATPIGNARDITLRALDLLAGADAILCEDTRRTGKLLAIYGIRRPMICYHEHNAARVRPGLVVRG